jgi:universal stress protein A
MVMSIYTNILVAVDLRVTHDVYTISRSIEISQQLNADIQFIHVMEAIHGYGAFEGQVLIDMERKIAEGVRKSFYDLVSGYEMAEDQLIIETGSPKQVIVEQAKKLNVDLIIVGAHSDATFRNLAGSTANGVINSAHCDVLTIRTAE